MEVENNNKRKTGLDKFGDGGCRDKIKFVSVDWSSIDLESFLVPIKDGINIIDGSNN